MEILISILVLVLLVGIGIGVYIGASILSSKIRKNWR